jgi:hypothetical protein
MKTKEHANQPNVAQYEFWVNGNMASDAPPQRLGTLYDKKKRKFSEHEIWAMINSEIDSAVRNKVSDFVVRNALQQLSRDIRQDLADAIDIAVAKSRELTINKKK